MHDIDPYQNKNLIRKQHIRGLIYATLLVTLLLIATLSTYFSQQDQFHQELVAAENSELFEMARIIEQEFLLVSSDLMYFSNSSLAQETLEKHAPEAKKYLTDLMLKISSTQNRFDQIRLLDKNGLEIIRINHRPGNAAPYTVPEPQLQDKAGRYYFTAASKLAPDQIYTSDFDLNIENGVIERPLKPVIRFAMPIYNKTGTLLGVGVVNYRGNRLFSRLKQIRNHPHNPFYLLNADGFCIKGENPDEDWDFMFNKDQPPPFPQKRPDVWATINQQQTGDVIDREGHFFFKHINLSPPPPFKAYNKQPIILILQVPQDTLSRENELFTFNLGLIFLLLAPLMAFLGWKLGVYQIHQKHLFHVLEYEATHDPLTGLYNRKAIMDILKRSMALATRRNAPLALGYLDINDLKKINDEVGHDAGDQMIIGAALAMSGIIRDSDSAARIGGDEFLILFPDCSKEDAAIVMERIRLHFAGQGLQKTGQKWAISLGCSELKQESDSPDSIIDRADKMMYAHKNLCKSQDDGGALP